MVNYFSKRGLRKYQEHVQAVQDEFTRLQGLIGETTEGTNTWHDNAGYDHLQIDIEVAHRRLASAKEPLIGAQIVEYPLSVDQVALGSEVEYSIDGTINTIEIVAFGDDDIDNNKIGYKAPLCQSMLKHKVGDEYKHQFHNTTKLIKIIRIAALSWAKEANNV